jgi:hypothetical protein
MPMKYLRWHDEKAFSIGQTMADIVALHEKQGTSKIFRCAM